MAVRALASMLLALSLLALSLAACSRASPAPSSATREAAAAHAHAAEVHEAAAAAEAEAEVPTLALADLLEPGATLKPSPKASAFAEKRVRLVGFMADMEHLSTDALYLVPRPVHCDEGGGGTGDLPPDAVLVTVVEARGSAREPNSDAPAQELVHLKGPVEAVGVFSIGNHADEQGRVANFRLRLDADSLRKAL